MLKGLEQVVAVEVKGGEIQELFWSRGRQGL